MARLLLFILFSGATLLSGAQDMVPPAALTTRISTAANDEERINALAALAEYFSVFNLGHQSDSVLQKALMIAEVSADRSMVLKLVINNTVTNLNSRSDQKTFDKAIHVIQNALRYAQDIGNTNLEALAYIRLAGIYRRKYLYDEALQNATKAVTAVADHKDADSIRVELFCELGDIYLAKSDPVPACKNYNTAFEIAYRKKNIRLQSIMYHRFSELYRSFKDDESAKNYLFESLRQNIARQNPEGEFSDYIDLARITNHREYIEKAAVLAVKINSVRYQMQARRLMYYWYMVEGKNSAATFKFLEANPDLIKYFNNSGPSALTWQKGSIYKYAGQFDSALFFLRAAEQDMLSSNNPVNDLNTYNFIAETYLESGDTANAGVYLEKAFALARQLNQLPLLASVGAKLGELAAQRKNYAQAYYYVLRADSANKILQANAAKDKIALLEIDRENKKGETDRKEMAAAENRKYNLQIMAITILIVLFFGLMLFMGMFEVSKTTIKVVGYFTFISLFEFIILILDHPIIEFTHGEPLRLWFVKIGLIALLVPIQHYLEKRVITYLQSRELYEARRKFSVKNWFRKKKDPVTGEEESFEDSTAVL